MCRDNEKTCIRTRCFTLQLQTEHALCSHSGRSWSGQVKIIIIMKLKHYISMVIILSMWLLILADAHINHSDKRRLLRASLLLFSIQFIIQTIGGLKVKEAF